MRTSRTGDAGPSLTFTLTGWKAVAVLAVVLGAGGYRAASARAALDTEGRAALEAHVATRIQAGMLAASAPATEEDARALLDAGRVTVRSLSARGPRDDLVARVELEPDPALPAGTELVRYYRMEHGSVTGWRVRGETTRTAYWLAMF